jgi:dihydrofolate reductase
MRSPRLSSPTPGRRRNGDRSRSSAGSWGAEIADLKARDDEGTVLVHGGPGFAKSLTRLGLVDEYQLTTVPIAIGVGRSPFAELGEHLKLDVVEQERFSSGALGQILVPKR